MKDHRYPEEFKRDHMMWQYYNFEREIRQPLEGYGVATNLLDEEYWWIGMYKWMDSNKDYADKLSNSYCWVGAR